MESKGPTVRIEPALHASLQEAARRHQVSLDHLVELYCTEGLAGESAPPLEARDVPALRALLEEIVDQCVERQVDGLANRLSNLTLRSIRHAAFAHRFAYHSVARTDPAAANAIEAQAAQDTAWLLVTNLGDEPPGNDPLTNNPPV